MLYWVIVGLVLTIWVLAVALLSEREWFSKHSHGKTKWSKDIFDKGEPIPYYFHSTYNYTNFDQKAIHHMYDKYPLPEELVAVPVPDAKCWGLPQGLPTKKNPKVGGYYPAFIHQFHCLTLFRDNLWDLRRQLNQVPPNFIPQTFEDPEKERLDHVEHCLDYMRQTVACWADTTMEGPAHHDDGQITNVDGMDMKHQCWDLEAIWEDYKSKLVPIMFRMPDGTYSELAVGEEKHKLGNVGVKAGASNGHGGHHHG